VSESEKILLDREDANIRRVAGCDVQTIPKRWRKRRDLKAFFQSDLEVLLFRENGQPLIEIRRVPKE